MRIGSISQGKTRCDACGRTVPYAERYLIVKETGGVEDEEKGVARHYCVKCATGKGYSSVRTEKGERLLTFFQDMVNPVTNRPEAGEAETAEADSGSEGKQDE